nr:MAG TPA: hypothetical protein [Caudoviricetes sp.]
MDISKVLTFKQSVLSEVSSINEPDKKNMDIANNLNISTNISYSEVNRLIKCSMNINLWLNGGSLKFKFRVFSIFDVCGEESVENIADMVSDNVKYMNYIRVPAISLVAKIIADLTYDMNGLSDIIPIESFLEQEE